MNQIIQGGLRDAQAHLNKMLGGETAATNALSHEFDIAKVQERLGRANISTTRLYDQRRRRPRTALTFHVKY